MIHSSFSARYLPAVSIIVLGVLALAGTENVEAQTQDWPLKCNLRGTSRLSLDNDGFTLSFTGATAGVAQREPAPGECAWRDRGWREGEPQRIVWNSGEPLLARVAVAPDNTVITISLNQDARQDNRDAMALVWDAWQGEEYIIVRVFRPKCGDTRCDYLEVTSIFQ